MCWCIWGHLITWTDEKSTPQPLQHSRWLGKAANKKCGSHAKIQCKCSYFLIKWNTGSECILRPADTISEFPSYSYIYIYMHEYMWLMPPCQTVEVRVSSARLLWLGVRQLYHSVPLNWIMKTIWKHTTSANNSFADVILPWPGNPRHSQNKNIFCPFTKNNECGLKLERKCLPNWMQFGCTWHCILSTNWLLYSKTSALLFSNLAILLFISSCNSAGPFLLFSADFLILHQYMDSLNAQTYVIHKHCYASSKDPSRAANWVLSSCCAQTLYNSSLRVNGKNSPRWLRILFFMLLKLKLEVRLKKFRTLY